MENWTTPLSQMKFLDPSNTSPKTAEIGSSVMCDILTQQKKMRPSRIAVEAWDGSLTYTELYDLSRQMAAFLLQKGVSPEERIGIRMKKSKWALVTFWGIFLTGCTGLPLDIRTPESGRRHSRGVMLATSWQMSGQRQGWVASTLAFSAVILIL